jgi:aminopeptidase N
VPYGYTERQTNIVDWYPYIPPYLDGQGWLVHSKWWFGEHQVFAAADFTVRLTLAEPVENLVIAASAPAEQNGNSYTYHLESARSFALSASTEYVTQTTTSGNITVTSYYFPYDRYAGLEVMQNTADALGLFSHLIAPYPYASLSVVEADFLDGMEYDGLFFLSHGFYDLYDGTPKGYLTFIAAHETAHQWFYGLVGNDQALEPWLDEALCTYMEHVFYENLYNDYSPSSGQSLVDWWWYYRVNFYDPTGWVDGSIYDFSQFRQYRDAVYLNGAKFLDELRSLVGDEAFFAFIRDYAAQKTHRIATASDFFTILKQHTSVDLDGLLTRYFQSSR